MRSSGLAEHRSHKRGASRICGGSRFRHERRNLTPDGNCMKVTRCSLILAVSLAATLGQTFQVKDRNGIAVVTISDIKLFRYSTILNQTVPHFQGTLTNNTNERLHVSIIGTVHKK